MTGPYLRILGIVQVHAQQLVDGSNNDMDNMDN